MCKWSVCVLLFGFFLNVLAEVTIKELSGTDTAEIGTSISLKCEYEFENETGVEVKWFYNQNVQIVSWIPNLNSPHAIGTFRTILDVSDSTLKDDIMHSTIRFKELTFNLTGNYTCKVSADDGEDAKTESMVVYQAARSMDFLIEESSETLICSASDVYPQPNITVIARVSESNESISVIVEDEFTTDTDENSFNVTKIFRFDGSTLEGLVEFTCSVFIPETKYNEERVVRYDKRSQSVLGLATTSCNSWMLLLVAALLAVYNH